MASINKVILIGNLGRDPEIRYGQAGNAVCNLSMATNRQWTDKRTGEKVQEDEWHRIVLYDRLAEVAGEYLKKGSPCYVEGRLKTRKWQDKDGIDRYTTEIVAESMQMLGNRGDGQHQHPQQSANRPARNSYEDARAGRTPPAQGDGFEDMDDDVPF